MAKFKLVLIILFITISTWSQGQGSEKNTAIVYNFSNGWLRYDNAYENFLPIFEKELGEYAAIHQYIPIEKYNRYCLKFNAAKGLSLFINNKLLYTKITAEEEEIVLSLDSIDLPAQGDVLFTFYHKDKILPLKETFIVVKTIKKQEAGTKEDLLLTVFRDDKSDNQAFVFAFLGIILFIVLFKQLYPKEFIRYFSWVKVENSDFLLPSVVSIPSIWMAITSGLAFALLVYLSGVNKFIAIADYSFVKGFTVLTLLYLAFYVAKYSYVVIIARLFSYTKISSQQFFEFTSVFERICIACCIVFFGITSSGIVHVNIPRVILYYSLIIVLLYCVLKVIFLFFRLISHRNLYLFSYLCAAEILPLIIAVKILLF